MQNVKKLLAVKLNMITTLTEFKLGGYNAVVQNRGENTFFERHVS